MVRGKRCLGLLLGTNPGALPRSSGEAGRREKIRKSSSRAVGGNVFRLVLRFKAGVYPSASETLFNPMRVVVRFAFS